VPASLKYYDSNNAIIAPKHSDELPKKRFEFIVQGLQSGDCEIPEQLFTYFDIERNEYITLRTSPLAISIMPGIVNMKKNEIIQVSRAEKNMNVITQEQIEDINKVGQWYPDGEPRSLPWWLLQLLFLIPCFYIGCPFIIEKFIILTGNKIRLARRHAFRHARKQINQAIKTADDKNLYNTFAVLFQQLEYEQDLPIEMSVEWKRFFEQITHAAYTQSDNKNSDELCRMAKQWLDRLEKII
jgi:hypothetical protein